jgi:DNA polymerase-3 subunit epsilon
MLGLDLETTGIDPYTDRPVAWSCVDFVGEQVTATWDGIIDPGVPIPPEASAIHGFTDDDVRSVGLPLLHTVVAIVAALRAAPVVVGMNLSFDLTILDSCWRRIFARPLPRIYPVVDLYVLDKRVDRWRKGSRKLTCLAEHYGIERGERHEATSDVIAAVRTTRAVCDRFPTVGTLTPHELHALQVRWRYAQQASLSDYRVEQGDDPIPREQWEWPVWKPARGYCRDDGSDLAHRLPA